MSEPILRLDNIRAGYEDSVVIDGLSLVIEQGEVVCLLGANGAGKTTTMRAVTGLISLQAGTITYDGEDISQMPPHERVTTGICLSPEGRQVFPDLTVMENLALGSFNRRARPNRKESLDRVFTLFPKLGERREQAAGLMSGGEQQMLAIGRALMGQPKLLALDEPSLGLSPKMVSTVFEAVQTIARSGITILLVEQNARAALTVAQRGYVLSAGRVAHEGLAGDLAESESFKRLLSARPSAQSVFAKAAGNVVWPKSGAGEPVLKISGLSKRYGGVAAISGLSLELARGEVLGVIGPNGAGKTTLLNLITGYSVPNEGSILFEGKELRGLAPYEICRLGVARTFQVVRPFAEMTVNENVMTGALFASDKWISAQDAALRAERALDMVGLLHKKNVFGGDLTIGEKKKLELARALATQSKLLLLDEVMSGLTGAEIEAIMDAIERVADFGVTILMIEHLVGVILALADRVLVLNFGRELFQGEPEEVIAHPDVIESYLGRPLEKLRS